MAESGNDTWPNIILTSDRWTSSVWTHGVSASSPRVRPHVARVSWLVNRRRKATPLRGLKTRVFFDYESTIIDEFCPVHDDLWIHAFSPNLLCELIPTTKPLQVKDRKFFFLTPALCLPHRHNLSIYTKEEELSSAYRSSLVTSSVTVCTLL